jgi:tetratricopeptide (TPR) repeat protein
VRGGTVWLPLETTMMNSSFLAAWKEGMKEFNAAGRGSKKMDLVDIRSAWQQYPPVDLSTDVTPAVVPSTAIVNDLVTNDVKVLTQDLMAHIDGDVAVLQQQKTECSANRAAQLLTVAGKYDEAAGLLKQYVSSASLNNLGNIYFLKGDSLDAFRAYQSAFKADHNDAGIVLNMGVLKFMGGDEESAAATMKQGADMLESKAKAYDMLGLPSGDDQAGDRKGAEKKKTVDKADLKRLLDSALKDVTTKKAKDPLPVKTRRGENKFIFGGRRGIDPSTVIALKDILYWKIPA